MRATEIIELGATIRFLDFYRLKHKCSARSAKIRRGFVLCYNLQYENYFIDSL